MRILKCVRSVVLLCAAAACLNASDDGKKFDKLLEEASRKTNLMAPGSAPFHLKLLTVEKYSGDPQFQGEIEMWWAAPDKWRREVRIPAFSQTAVQNGSSYYEDDSSDFMPFWLHELIQGATDPVPLEALKDEVKTEEVELSQRWCEFPAPGEKGTPPLQAAWQTFFAAEGEQIDVHNQICFAPDGAVAEMFTRPFSAKLANQQKFKGKWTAGLVVVWASRAEIRGTVIVLEPLKIDDSHFVIAKDTGLNSRLRFVRVAQSALEPYKLETPSIVWPTLHTFPTKGAVSFDVKIDRNGKIRDIGTIISRNVAINDAIKEQIQNWKFKPYPNADAPVQVDTNITLKFDSKVELLGGNGKTTSLNFFQRIAKAKELSDLRLPGSQPFHLRASFDAGADTPGKYEEIWVSPEKWWRHVELAGVTVVKTRAGDELFTQRAGAPYTPKRIDEFLDALEVPFPDTGGSFIEGDWGHSAVTFDSADMVRIARGRVNEKNQPIDGQAYWFDEVGLLHAAYWDPRMISYGEWFEWNGKRIPRRMELTVNGAREVLTTIEQVESPATIDDTLFVLNGVQPEKIGGRKDYDGPPVVQPHVLYQAKAAVPASEHGTVVVVIQLDQHGHVISATVKESAGTVLDEAAVKSALQWEFTPKLIRGLPVSSTATVRFQF